ncbi:hypothetical protein [Sporomusa sphaeroides]
MPVFTRALASSGRSGRNYIFTPEKSGPVSASSTALYAVVLGP